MTKWSILSSIFIMMLFMIAFVRATEILGGEEKSTVSEHKVLSADEYADLVKLLESDKVELPSIKEGKGEKILKRLTDPENLKPLTDKQLPLNQRFPACLKSLENVSIILRRYQSAINKGGDYFSEFSQVSAYSIRLAVVMDHLVDEFLPTIEKDSTFIVRVGGVRKMRMGLMTQISGSIESLKSRQFSEEDHRMTIRVLHHAMPVFKKYIMQVEKEFYTGVLQEQQKRYTGKELKMLNDMLIELKK